MEVRVKEFEDAFSRLIGMPYRVMVNSGSSANLLACSALVKPKRKKSLNCGDRVAIPSVCWSTPLWPIVQAGLIPEELRIGSKKVKRRLLNHGIDTRAIVSGNMALQRGIKYFMEGESK